MIGTILTALLVGGFMGLLVLRAIALPRWRMARQLAQIGAYGYVGDAPDGEPVRDGIGRPVDRLGGLLARAMTREQHAAVRKQLVRAGLYDARLETFLGYRAIALVAVPLMMTWLAASSHATATTAAGEIGVGAVIGYMLPRTVVQRRARQRLARIDHGMPELVDLLVVGVESGMGFNGAMRTACLRVDGPLGDELRLMLREQSLGASMTEALRNMLERAETPATISFVRTIVQGERLGVSIGQMMRALAEEMRKRRRATAEELANKAPIKLLFPLVFLIFPALFIVLLAPAAITTLKMFAGS